MRQPFEVTADDVLVAEPAADAVGGLVGDPGTDPEFFLYLPVIVRFFQNLIDHNFAIGPGASVCS